MSSQELATAEESRGIALSQPRGLAMSGMGINGGAVSIEIERAIAEAQGQIIIAKRFPRDLNAAFQELMESAKYASMAEVAFYKVPRGGGSVTGPSIRAAEELARALGNIEYGHRELSRSGGKSEVEVYAWDKQTNLRRIRQVTVPHTIDTKNGPKAVRDEKEIDDLIANKASKQVRSLLLSIVPVHLKEAFFAECKKTLAGANGGPTIAQRILSMQSAFSPFGVTVAMLEEHLGHKLADTTADELVDLSGIYNALKEGGKPSEYFGADAQEDRSDAATDLAAAGRATAPKADKVKEPAKDQVKEPAKDPAKADTGAKDEPQPKEQEKPKETPAAAETPKDDPKAPPAEEPAPDKPTAEQQAPETVTAPVATKKEAVF